MNATKETEGEAALWHKLSHGLGHSPGYSFLVNAPGNTADCPRTWVAATYVGDQDRAPGFSSFSLGQPWLL